MSRAIVLRMDNQRFEVSFLVSGVVPFDHCSLDGPVLSAARFKFVSGLPVLP